MNIVCSLCRNYVYVIALDICSIKPTVHSIRVAEKIGLHSFVLLIGNLY